MPTVEEKIASLRAMSAPFVAEVVTIEWGDPDGTKHYACTQLDEISPSILDETDIEEIDCRLIAPNVKQHELFQAITVQGGISDDEVTLKFWDGDGAFSDLMETHGEGIRVILSYWFPDMDLFLPHFWGHLRTAEGADEVTFPVKVASGFRSSQIAMPHRRHLDPCQLVYGGLLDTQEAINQHGCPYNRHIGGSVGNLDGGEPIPTCPQNEFADCDFRLGPFPMSNGQHRIFASHKNIQGTLINLQTQGPALTVVSRGNQTNIKRTVRVILGVRTIRELDLLQYAPQPNTGNPGDGFVRVMFEVSEGPIQAIVAPRVNGTLLGINDYQIRLGELGQAPTTFANPVNNYSGTALFYGVWGRVNPANYGPQNLSGGCAVWGLRNLRIYTNSTTYTEQFSQNRAWHLLEMFTNKRWGFGLDYARCDINSFIDCAIWGGKDVVFTDPEGTAWAHPRSYSNIDLVERPTQQQISDICFAGRFSPPFIHNGLIRIVPFRALTEDELEEAPVFTDTGENRNIVREKDGRSTLKRYQTSDVDLVNEVTVTADADPNDNSEIAITVRDREQQLKAGRAMGDTSVRLVEKKYALNGVTIKAQVVKMAWALLDLGKFDGAGEKGGGLKNNLRIKFRARFLDCLLIHLYQVIKVESNQLTRYGFDYFRVIEMKRASNLEFEITAQAYPVDYYNDFEIEYEPGNPAVGATYEAEDATLGGGAEILEDEDMSGGEGVTGIGSGGTLLFEDVPVSESGFYLVKIYYKNAAAQTLMLTVRNSTPAEVEFPDSGSELNFIEVAMYLSQTATNTLMFANAAAAGPDIDKIVVPFTRFTLGGGDDGGGNGCVLHFGEVNYGNGQLRIPILPC